MANAEKVRELYDAFGRGDMDTVLGAMDSQIEWREAEGNPYQPDGSPWVGPEAIVQNLFMKLGTEWDDFAARPESFHDAGDAVVVEGRYSGAYKESGKRIDAQFCHVWKMAGDKLTSFQQFTDTGQFQDAMGAR